MSAAVSRGMPIDVGRLRTLQVVIECGSVTAASRALGVTPSAVSQQIAALERDVGRALIERTSTGVLPTATGELLGAQSRKVADLLEETVSALRVAESGISGRVSLAAVASACIGLVTDALAHLGHAQPGLEVSVSSLEPSESLMALSTGRVDVAVVDQYDHVPLALPADLEARPIAEDPLVVVSPTGRFPAGPVRLSALKDEAWVIPPVAAACGQAVRTACRNVGFEPSVRWESDDMAVLEHAVRAECGISVLPSRAVRPDAVGIDVARLWRPALRRQLIVVARRSVMGRPSVSAVVDALVAVAR